MNKKRALWFVSWFVLITSIGCTQVVLPVTPTAPVGQATEVVAPTAVITPTVIALTTVDVVTTVVALPTTVVTPTLSLDTTHLITREESMTANTNAPNLQVEQAMKDLAVRTSIPLDEIELVDYEIVVWPDGGLGCPQPGMLYPQVQVDGMLIHLRAHGVQYAYHSGGSRAPFLCENPTSAKPPPQNLTPQAPSSTN